MAFVITTICNYGIRDLPVQERRLCTVCSELHSWLGGRDLLWPWEAYVAAQVQRKRKTSDLRTVARRMWCCAHAQLDRAYALRWWENLNQDQFDWNICAIVKLLKCQKSGICSSQGKTCPDHRTLKSLNGIKMHSSDIGKRQVHINSSTWMVPWRHQSGVQPRGKTNSRNQQKIAKTNVCELIAPMLGFDQKNFVAGPMMVMIEITTEFNLEDIISNLVPALITSNEGLTAFAKCLEQKDAQGHSAFLEETRQSLWHWIYCTLVFACGHS